MTWNISNNHAYQAALKQNILNCETEILTTSNKFNEYILTRLRTKWGINLEDLKLLQPSAINKLKHQLIQFQENALVKEQKGFYFLTDLGKYEADGISAELFVN